STSNKQVRTWRPDLNETASTKPGAIQGCCIAFALANIRAGSLGKGVLPQRFIIGGVIRFRRPFSITPGLIALSLIHSNALPPVYGKH
ncbi:hypothetical protein, partial [Stutzerimonas stutzeri]|uniref:hypothetical protein n=1 Tax=Stutzerimonas stutzeri TaxID=316 RepID=UPI001C8C13FC